MIFKHFSIIIKRILSIRAKGIRFIGVLFSLLACIWIVSTIISIVISHPVNVLGLNIAPWTTETTDVFLGIKEVSGWTAKSIQITQFIIVVFLAIGFLSLWRTAWYVSLFDTGYSIASGINAILSGYIAKLIGRHANMEGDIVQHIHGDKITEINSIYLCWTLVFIILFVYIVTEKYWFFQKDTQVKRRYTRLHIVKGILCLLIASFLIVWTYVLGDEVKRKYYFAKLKSDVPEEHYIARKELPRFINPKLCREIILLLPQANESQANTIADIFLDHHANLNISAITRQDLPLVYDLSNSIHPRVRRLAVRLFRDIATLEARKRLLVLLDDVNDEVRFESINSLALIRDRTRTDALFNVAQKHSDQKTILAVAGCLGILSDMRILELLKPFLVSNDPQVRGKAYSALGSFYGTELVEVINKGLTDPDVYVRSRACWALWYKGNKESIEQLIQLLKGKEDVYEYPNTANMGSLHEDASCVLGTLTRQDFEKDSEAWATWWEKVKSTFDIESHVLSSLNSKDEYKQAVSFRCVRAMNLKATVPILKDMTTYKDSISSFKAAEILAEWGYKEGIRYFIDSLGNKGGSLKVNKGFAISILTRVTGQDFLGNESLWLD